ncbi:purine-nucleoside phosphorylase [uncultured Brachyspira sp.]|uniref:purine-nucleoside phosphorylase n=1 Tax=uncultured Brachyspira sp. TaxID=221953 RepID=UPI0025E67BC3|nr:purine-nucleoside phosphorylase [uncultured Brachyspira sp.]
MSTPHISANKGDIAETILLPGDPLRAKFIAENFLENVIQYNSVRNMLGFTGTYNGKRVSVQGTGMGMPSCSIYSYELIHFYECRNLIRIGSAGALSDKLHIGDLVIAMGACTDSNYASQYELPGTYAPIASYELLKNAVKKSDEMKINYHVGNIVSSDLFYSANNSSMKWAKMGVLAVEMEAAALYMNAAYANVNALCIATISDSLVTGESTTSEQREKTFTNMMEVALSLV